MSSTNRLFVLLTGLAITLPALAEDEPAASPSSAPEIDWRNSRPGFGFGLVFDQARPSASLRGWSSAALSVDVGGTFSRTSGEVTVNGGSESSAVSTVGVFVAPRVRVWGSKNTDVLVVPSVQYDGSFGAGNQSGVTLRGGVAVDQWISPGVSFTGGLNFLQVQSATLSSDEPNSAQSFQSFSAGITPNVALHVFPRRRATQR